MAVPGVIKKWLDDRVEMIRQGEVEIHPKDGNVTTYCLPEHFMVYLINLKNSPDLSSRKFKNGINWLKNLGNVELKNR